MFRPIKESNWLLLACCINFCKMTSGSSTPLGEVLPILNEGKAHEELQVVCLKKYRIKKKKSKAEVKKRISLKHFLKVPLILLMLNSGERN